MAQPASADGRLPRRARTAVAAFVVGVAAACAPAIQVRLPDPAGGTPDAIGHRTVASLSSACSTTTVTANVGVAGRVGRQRVRGTLQVGTARPGRVRIDAVAPFGVPIFVLASDGETTTLVLPRERAFIRGASVAQILDALIQVPLTADDLAAVLLACPRTPVDDERSRQLVDGEVSAADAEGVTAFARVAPSARLTGLLFPVSPERARRVAVAYPLASSSRRVVDVEVGTMPAAAAQLRLTLSDVETGAVLGPEAFIAVVPDGARALSLDELRRLSPFAAASPAQ